MKDEGACIRLEVILGGELSRLGLDRGKYWPQETCSWEVPVREAMIWPANSVQECLFISMS